MDTSFDVVVVGGGAAGLSSGIVLARAQVAVALLDDGHPRNAPATAMHGFVTQDGVLPEQFLRMGKEEFSRYGGTVQDGRVGEVRRQPDGSFRLQLRGYGALTARAVVIATGLTDVLPEIPGLKDLWGSLVHHCPHCHGFEVRGQETAVLGGEMPPMTIHQAALLSRQSDHVTLYLNDMSITDQERQQLARLGITMVEGQIVQVSASDHGGVELEILGGTPISCDAVFVAPHPRANDAILRELGCQPNPDTGWIDVDATGATSEPGVWAAGNVVNPRAQVVTAASEGSVVGIAVAGWLLDRDLKTTAIGG